MLHPRLTLALLGGLSLSGVACAGAPPFEDEYQRQQGNEDGGAADGSQSGPNGNPSPVSNTNEDGGSTGSTNTGDDGGGTTSTGDDGSGTTSTGDDGGAGTLNGCTPADFAANDDSAAGAARTITVGTSGQIVFHVGPDTTPPPPSQYTPHCMTVAAGQSVTWDDAFTSYPLAPSGGTTPTPITSVTSGTSTSFTFPSAGTYGFNNPNAPTVMFGAILVTQ